MYHTSQDFWGVMLSCLASGLDFFRLRALRCEGSADSTPRAGGGCRGVCLQLIKFVDWNFQQRCSGAILVQKPWRFFRAGSGCQGPLSFET